MKLMSSAHSLNVQGANKFINEVNESRRVVNQVFKLVNEMKKGELDIFHEWKATTQNDNLKNIINFHNSKNREYDISLHFNSAKFNGKDYTDNPVGIEIYYFSSNGKKLAEQYLNKLVKVTGLKNRGIKQSSNLRFLNETNKPSILIELCFVNSKKDVEIYKNKFDDICIAMAELITGITYNKSLSTKGVYQVVTNSYMDKDNAIKYQEELKKKGINSFLEYEVK